MTKNDLINLAYSEFGIVADDGKIGKFIDAVLQTANIPIKPISTSPAAVAVPKCPFPCGWENLHKLAVAEGAFLANSLREDEPLTEHQRDTVMRVVNYSIEMARAALAATRNMEINDVAVVIYDQLGDDRTVTGDEADAAIDAAIAAAKGVSGG